MAAKKDDKKNDGSPTRRCPTPPRAYRLQNNSDDDSFEDESFQELVKTLNSQVLANFNSNRDSRRAVLRCLDRSLNKIENASSNHKNCSCKSKGYYYQASFTSAKKDVRYKNTPKTDTTHKNSSKMDYTDKKNNTSHDHVD